MRRRTPIIKTGFADLPEQQYGFSFQRSISARPPGASKAKG